MSNLLTDLRHAVRRLRRSPGFTLVAVLTLGIGIGATTAVFSLVRSVLLAPLPYPAPDRLVDLSEVAAERPAGGNQVSYPTFRDWTEGARSLEATGGYARDVVTVTVGTVTERVPNVIVTPGLFDVLGVPPALGRPFRADEATPGNDRVVVMSNDYWMRHFAGARDAIGRTIVIGRNAYTVVGVMPEGFAFPFRDVALWTPLTPAPFMENRGVHILDVVGRLADDVDIEHARAELVALGARLDAQFGAEHPGHGVAISSLHERLVGDLRPLLRVLMAAVVGVLLIACANLAHLLLARAAPRRAEVTVRAALGASAGRIVRHMLAEGVAVSVLGGLLGFGIAVWTVSLLGGRLPESTAQIRTIAVDGGALLFAAVVSIATGIVAAAVPAFRASRLPIGAALRQADARETGGRGTRRFRSGLVVVEVAVSLVLMLAGGLLLASFAHVLRVDPGFRTERMLTMTVSPSPAAASDADAVIAFYDRATERLAGLPGVEEVSAANRLPLSGGNSNGTLTIEGRAFAPAEEYPAGYLRVRPGYFRTMGIPLRRGRDFDDRDDGDPMSVIISASMADRFWPDGDPVGRRIKVGVPEREPWLTIVGVVGDVRNEALDIAPRFLTYEPHTQRVWRTMQLVVRTAGDPLLLAGPVRDALTQFDAEILIYDVGSIGQRVGASLAARRFILGVIGAFAGVALVLALVGVYGVIAYTVTQRTRELGIRMALGARAGAVLRLVLGQAAGLIAAGIGVGVIAALLVLRGLRSMLFGVRPTDPMAFGLMGAALCGVALLAAYVPARRASRVDPMEALRHE